MKPYYETDLGKLYHGDCLEIMPQLEPVDLMIADIPYDAVNRKSNGLRCLDKKDADVFNLDIKSFLKQSVKTTNGCIYVFCGWHHISTIYLYFRESLSTRIGFWEKTNPSPMNGEYIWLSGVEYFMYAKKKGGVHNVKCKNPVFRNPITRNQMHPTQKPTGVIQEMVLASSLIYNTVLDPFLGSGTTAVVCEQTNRKWIGIEISEKYCEIAAKRIESENRQLKLF